MKRTFSPVGRASIVALMVVVTLATAAPAALEANERASSEPRARLEPAPLLEFPADPDCNSPCFWHEGQLHLFTSNQKPSRSVGPDLARLGAPVRSVFDDGAGKLRWIEAVHLREDGVLFGLYHREEYLGECPDREYFTVPDIGVARSRDLGRTWTDLGIVLQDHGVSRSCDTPNKFFAGGVGDPSWAIDRVGGQAYIFFSSYTDPLSNQGVQVARLALGDLEAPVGKVWRWTGGRWDAPGLGGKASRRCRREWRGQIRRPMRSGGLPSTGTPTWVSTWCW